MTIQNHVCSSELSKRLKELGVTQKSFFCWQDVKESEPVIWPRTFDLSEFRKGAEDNRIAAFLGSELVEMLPGSITSYNELIISKSEHFKKWNIKYESSRTHEYEVTDHNFSDAMAKMLIYLIENNLLDVKDL